MATVQLPPAMQPNNLQNAEANRANDDPVTPITLFLRYLYTGSTSASIPAKSTKVRDLSTIDNTLACVMNMANAQPNLPVATIRKVRFFRYFCCCCMNSEKRLPFFNNFSCFCL